MQLSKLFTKLLTMNSQIHDLQPKQESVPTTNEDNRRPQDDRPWIDRPIRDQKLLTLYKVMDMGA